MRKSLDTKRLIWAAAVIGLITLLMQSYFQSFDIGLNADTLKSVPTIVAVIWFFWELFRRHLWSMKLFNPWLVKVPNLTGSWEGQIVSTWKDPDTGKSPAPIETSAEIRQTISDITIDLLTGEMESTSSVANISYDPTRKKSVLHYIYQSDPNPDVRHRSGLHYGAAELCFKEGEKGDRLTGNYWTDRKTTGSIKLHKVGPKKRDA